MKVTQTNKFEFEVKVTDSELPDLEKMSKLSKLDKCEVLEKLFNETFERRIDDLDDFCEMLIGELKK